MSGSKPDLPNPHLCSFGINKVKVEKEYKNKIIMFCLCKENIHYYYYIFINIIIIITSTIKRTKIIFKSCGLGTYTTEALN